MSDKGRVWNRVVGNVTGAVVQVESIGHLVLPTPRPASEVPIPRQLPRVARDFTGRGGELAALDALLEPEGDEPAGPVVVVEGMAGVGKTSLTVYWASRAQERFPDGTLFTDLCGHGSGSPLDPDEVLADFLLALGVPPDAVPVNGAARAGLYRSLLAQRRVLVVLDNAGSAAQVRPLLPGSPGCAAVVTARGGMAGLIVNDGAVLVEVGIFSEPEAVALVRRIVGTVQADLEQNAVAVLIGLCGRLPLALRIATSRVVTHRRGAVEGVVAEIAEDRLGALDVPHDERSAVRTVFDWSYAKLPSRHARLFRLLGLHPGPEFGVHAAAVLANVDYKVAYRCLEALVDLHLIERAEDSRRYRMHDLLHVYARERALHDEPDCGTPFSHLLVWYAATAQAADEVAFPGPSRANVDLAPVGPPLDLPDRAVALAWLTSERATLIAALYEAASLSIHQPVIALAAAVRFLAVAGSGALPLRLEAETIGVAAARALGDRQREMVLLCRRGDTYQNLGRWQDADADYGRVLGMAEASDDSIRVLEALCGIGLTCKRRGRYLEAWERYIQALPLARGAGEWAEAVVECNLSQLSSRLGRYRQALRHADRELELRRRLADPVGEALALCDAALAWQGLGRHDAVIRLCHDAITLYERHGGVGVAISLPMELMAFSLESTGEPVEAKRHLSAAEAILRRFGDPHAEELRTRADLRE
ncbi:tetratricopeptide repeat protein [Lentzea cavernae]|uniref:NB-ARC domain-containing protein n=1 Tax=Lentzea cavernae TaxID=2020703 RepID=A0ABQ3MFA6_9PSEU|nr:tetratricopeptide repeat protein [Lentzea cavernae]GHH42161.1 hypothetical protein GCM10017774_38000 [Lentzea cavernae]